MRAAAANGAEAVYFGVECFNARMRAANFQQRELPSIVQWLHRQIRGQGRREARQADVLDDQGVHPGGGGGQHQLAGLLQLIAEHEHIQGEIGLH
ncbi:MAG: hypothetical protein ACKOPS_28415, partial [Cyanobium sp.]